MLDAALEKGCSLIVTHHPILFGGRKNLCEDTAEGRLLCRLVRAHMNLIAAHTNYDVAAGGVNDCLAEALGLTNVQCVDGDEEAILRIGDVEPMTAAAFAARVTERLGDVVRVYGDRQKTVRRVALVGGAGGEYAPDGAEGGRGCVCDRRDALSRRGVAGGRGSGDHAGWARFHRTNCRETAEKRFTNESKCVTI